MKHLTIFESFERINRYDETLHRALVCMFMYDLKNWLSKEYYFELYFPIEKEIRLEEQIQEMRDLIDQVISRGRPIAPLKTAVFQLDISELYMSLKEQNDLGISKQKNRDLFSMYIVTNIDGPSSSSLKCYSTSAYAPIDSQVWSHIGFWGLCENWKNNPQGPYNFKEDMIMQHGQNLKKGILEYWCKVLHRALNWHSQSFSYRLVPLSYWSKDGKINVEMFKSSSLFVQNSQYLYNSSFFRDILSLHIQEKSKLPLPMSITLLMYNTGIDVPIDILDEKFLDLVQNQFGLLNLCKKNLPQVYQLIKSKRDEDQKWKTDLSAEMGDLGF